MFAHPVFVFFSDYLSAVLTLQVAESWSVATHISDDDSSVVQDLSFSVPEFSVKVEAGFS